MSQSENEEEGVFVDEIGAEEVIYLDSNEMEQDAITEDMGDNDEEEDEDYEDIPDDSEQAFFGHTDSIYSVSLHPTFPEFVLTGGGDDKAFVWNMNTGETVFELAGHKDTVTCTGVSVDGKLIATGSYDGTVGIWDTATGKLERFLEGPAEGIEWLSWHSKGSIVLAGSRDGTAWLWLGANGTCMNVFAGHSAPVTCGGFTPDGKHVVTASEDCSLRIWDPKTAAALHTFQGNEFHTEGIVSMGMREHLLMTGSQDSSIKLVNSTAGKLLGTFSGHTDSVESVGISSSLALAASGSLDKKVMIWDVSRLQQRGVCEHDDGVIKVQFHPTQPFLFSSSIDRTVRLWDGRTGKCEKIWRGHKDIILDFAVSQDGSMVVTGSDDHASMVFKV